MKRPFHPSDRWALLFAILFPTLLTYVYFTILRNAPTAIQNGVYATLKCVQFGFPIFWVCQIQRRSLDLHAPRRSGMGLAIGFGLVVLVAMGLLYKFCLVPLGLIAPALGPIRGKIVGFGVDTVPTYAALGIFYALIHSILEEYYWRWFVYGQLRSVLTMPSAAVLSSLGFTAHHVLLLGTFFGYDSPLTWIFSAAIAIGGIAWAWLYETTQSLYPVWLSHLLIDVGIFWIGYDLMRGDLW